MFELHRRDIPSADLRSEREILDWSPGFLKPIELYVRVRIGSQDRPRAAEQGTYHLRAASGGQTILPVSTVQARAADRQIWMISRSFVFGSGERLQVYVTGLAGDGDVDVRVVCYSIELPDAYQSQLVPVDHHYGGHEQLAYWTTDGEGVAGAVIHAYLKEDYDEGRRGFPYLHASTRTIERGYWERPLMLYPEDWVLVFFSPGRYGPDVVRLRIHS